MLTNTMALPLESIWSLWPQFSHILCSLCSNHTRLLSISRTGRELWLPRRYSLC